MTKLYSSGAIDCSGALILGMNCNDDIEENHLGAGNEKKHQPFE